MIQQIMRPRLIREPIHLNVSNRGRLRKIEHQKKEPSSLANDLAVAVKESSQDKKTQRKKRLYYHFNKMEDRALQGYTSGPYQSVETRSRDFRAIHTANSHQMDKASSNRSLTPRTHFNNTFRSTTINSKRRTRTRHLKQLPAQIKYPIIDKISASHRLMMKDEIYSSLHLSNQQTEEFYRYNHESINKTVNIVKPQNSNLISGMKIEPFQKSQMRQMFRGGLRDKLQRYNFTINQ